MRTITAIALSALVLASLFAVSTSTAQRAGSHEPTEITSCTTIDSSGHYVLTADVGSEVETCIEITASDVTFDGNGHSISDATVAIRSDGSNVAVSNVTIRGADEGIVWSGGEGRIGNVTVEEAAFGIVVRGGSNTTVEGSTVTSHSTTGDAGIRIVGNATGTTVRGNLVDGNFSSSGIDVETTDNAVVDNAVSNPENEGISVSDDDNVVRANTVTGSSEGGIFVFGDGVTVAGNTIADNGLSGVILEVGSSNATVENNTISETRTVGDGASYDKSIFVRGRDHVIRGNEIRDTGIEIEGSARNVTVERNLIEGYVGRDREDRSAIVITPPLVCSIVPAGPETVVIHHNDLDAAAYGIRNDNDEVVDATDNYWGTEDGPSSPRNASVEDPVTGTTADGSGANVTTGVHFDPWRSQPVVGTSGTE